jgi:hypothetical protein
MAHTVEITRDDAIRAVRRLGNMEETTINGITYTRMSSDVGTEIKVSPHGTTGDYDKDSYFFYWCDIPEKFEEGKTYTLVIE